MNQTDSKVQHSGRLWRIIDIISWGANYLEEKGFASSRLIIEILLAHILMCKRIDLYLNYDKPLTKDELAQLKITLKRILNHEPLPYVLSETQFLEHKILLNHRVFIPRPETEILAKQIIEDFKNKMHSPLKILDIGCGSGAISIALAKYFVNSNILAIDISDEALRQTEENATVNSIMNITIKKIDIIGSIPEGKYEIIVSNPPYLSIEEYASVEPNLLFEPRESLTDGADGLRFYRRFSEIFPVLLASDGKFYLEIGYNQAEQVAKIFAERKFAIRFIQDFNAIKRIVSN